MKNWKTTLFATLGALPTLLGIFGVHVSPAVAQTVLAVGTALAGTAAADASNLPPSK